MALAAQGAAAAARAGGGRDRVGGWTGNFALLAGLGEVGRAFSRDKRRAGDEEPPIELGEDIFSVFYLFRERVLLLLPLLQIIDVPDGIAPGETGGAAGFCVGSLFECCFRVVRISRAAI